MCGGFLEDHVECICEIWTLWFHGLCVFLVKKCPCDLKNAVQMCFFAVEKVLYILFDVVNQYGLEMKLGADTIWL